MSHSESLWTAKDEDGGEIVLDAIGRTGEWQFSVTEGRFSGYPTVDISREDLERLGAVIREALSIPEVIDINEIDRLARAYGFEIGRGKPMGEIIEVGEDNPFLDSNWRENMKSFIWTRSFLVED